LLGIEAVVAAVRWIFEEVSRKMRDTASETLALPFEEAASSFSSPITNNQYLFTSS
jgi:hypothetical protein